MSDDNSAERGLAKVPAFVDPINRKPLQSGDDGASLVEPSTGNAYPLRNGIADLVQPRMASDGFDPKRFDRPLPLVTEAALRWTFRAFGGDEMQLRSRVLDKLELKPDAVVLDNCSGTGATARLLQDRLPRGVLCNGDLSLELVVHAVQRAAEEDHEATCRTVWFGANALHLPFADDSFDAVVSMGGFNQFGDAARAIAEMTRVTRPGGRIAIADEGYAPWLRHSLTGRMVLNDNPLMAHMPPLEHLPEVARDVRLEWMLGNAFYCIDFRVGEAPPVVDVDLPHEGLRGGTMRSRYEGRHTAAGDPQADVGPVRDNREDIR